MLNEKFITCCEDKISDSSISNNVDDHGSLNADQEQAPRAHAFTYDACSSSGMLQCREGVPS
jgi:hypothetical protein